MKGEKDMQQIADRLRENGMRCNCNLDVWEPEKSTGHSHVCRIHKKAVELFRQEFLKR